MSLAHEDIEAKDAEVPLNGAGADTVLCNTVQYLGGCACSGLAARDMRYIYTTAESGADVQYSLRYLDMAGSDRCTMRYYIKYDRICPVMSSEHTVIQSSLRLTTYMNTNQITGVWRREQWLRKFMVVIWCTKNCNKW